MAETLAVIITYHNQTVIDFDFRPDRLCFVYAALVEATSPVTMTTPAARPQRIRYKDRKAIWPQTQAAIVSKYGVASTAKPPIMNYGNSGYNYY